VGEAVEEVVSAREEVLYTHIETENQLTQRTLTLTLTLADLFLFSDLLRFHRRGHLRLGRHTASAPASGYLHLRREKEKEKEVVLHLRERERERERAHTHTHVHTYGTYIQ